MQPGEHHPRPGGPLEPAPCPRCRHHGPGQQQQRDHAGAAGRVPQRVDPDALAALAAPAARRSSSGAARDGCGGVGVLAGGGGGLLAAGVRAPPGRCRRPCGGDPPDPAAGPGAAGARPAAAGLPGAVAACAKLARNPRQAACAPAMPSEIAAAMRPWRSTVTPGGLPGGARTAVRCTHRVVRGQRAVQSAPSRSRGWRRPRRLADCRPLTSLPGGCTGLVQDLFRTGKGPRGGAGAARVRAGGRKLHRHGQAAARRVGQGHRPPLEVTSRCTIASPRPEPPGDR